MIDATRTDRVQAAIEAELEDQRPGIDAGAPLTSVTLFVDLHPDGNVRRVKFRADREREIGRGSRTQTRGRDPDALDPRLLVRNGGQRD